MTKQLRTIGPLSVAKVAAILYALIGLLFGAFVSLLSLLGVFASSFGDQAAGQPGGALFGVLFGVGAIVVLPVVYACWAVAILVLFPLCAWFAGVKQRRRDPWLSYL